jgi:hypothetical protein
MKAWELLKAMQEDGAKVREPSMGTDYYAWRAGEFTSRQEGPLDDHKLACVVKYAETLSIIQEPHNLAWAMEQMRAGKAVCRPGAVFGVVLGDDGEFESTEDGEVVRLSAPSITAMDWRLWVKRI